MCRRNTSPSCGSNYVYLLCCRFFLALFIKIFVVLELGSIVLSCLVLVVLFFIGFSVFVGFVCFVGLCFPLDLLLF